MSTATSPWDQPRHSGRLVQPVSLLRLDGPDTRSFLHGQTSQAVAQAAPGQWLRTCCISPTGRMRALAEVLVDESGAWLAITAGEGGAVRAAFDRVLFPADQVHLGPLQSGWLITPLSPGTPAERPEPEGGSWRAVGEPQAELQAWLLGEERLLVQGDAPLPPALAADLPAAFSSGDQLNASDSEHWRIQRGLPAAPHELNDDTNPFELGLAERVSLSKGCYVGQETLAKLATYDGVKQQLRRWHLAAATGATEARAAAACTEPGSDLQGADGSRAGLITSSLELAEGQGRIGLALVRRRHLEAVELRALGSAGQEEAGPEAGAMVTLSCPEAFAPPPVGAGSAARL
ncbi:folate-binding protein YgfZ [Synechococcus sp. CS-1328]|uniref:CAF17-like 4Fe-4S cluster assembly/insertion protein YgfZ n=1 Tax=Synechococcus sp. CS-1328 TaxID=2847976 RepID=UPI00223AED41|nr:folate-binding protein [Synechococcus sp. CS-1328]MCT0223966.1 folate-binding protein [Synechococcus sp. CS-1328]